MIGTETHETYELEVSPVVGLSKNKNWILNLNNYRNAHYQTLNKAKVNFKKTYLTEISKLPKFTKLQAIEYTLYRDSHRHCDVANVCSIVDKFFCDALVEAGKLPDDNYDFLKTVSYQWGGVADKAYVKIKLIGELEMKINFNLTLDQKDIEKAVSDYAIAAYPDFAEHIKNSKVALIVNDGVVSGEFVFDSKVLSTKPVSSNSTGSRVSSHGGVSDCKPEPKTSDAAEVKEEKKEEELKEPDTTIPPFDSTPAEEPSNESSLKELESSAEPKPAKRNIFAKRVGDNNISNGAVGSSNPDNGTTGSASEQESSPDNGAKLEPAKVGASIFGRKKIS